MKGGSTTLKEAKEVKELGESKPSDKKTCDEKQHNHEQGQDGDVCEMKRGNIVCKNEKDEQTIDVNEETGYQNGGELDGDRGGSRLRSHF